MKQVLKSGNPKNNGKEMVQQMPRDVQVIGDRRSGKEGVGYLARGGEFDNGDWDSSVNFCSFFPRMTKLDSAMSVPTYTYANTYPFYSLSCHYGIYLFNYKSRCLIENDFTCRCTGWENTKEINDER